MLHLLSPVKGDKASRLLLGIDIKYWKLLYRPKLEHKPVRSSSVRSFSSVQAVKFFYPKTSSKEKSNFLVPIAILKFFAKAKTFCNPVFKFWCSEIAQKYFVPTLARWRRDKKSSLLGEKKCFCLKIPNFKLMSMFACQMFFQTHYAEAGIRTYISRAAPP